MKNLAESKEKNWEEKEMTKKWEMEGGKRGGDNEEKILIHHYHLLVSFQDAF